MAGSHNCLSMVQPAEVRRIGSAEKQVFQVLDSFQEAVAPLGHDQVDGVEVALAEEAASEVPVGVRFCVECAAIWAAKCEPLPTQVGRDAQVLDDSGDHDVISELAKKIGRNPVHGVLPPLDRGTDMEGGIVPFPIMSDKGTRVGWVRASIHRGRG